MPPNDVLRRLRYAMDLADHQVREMMHQGAADVSPEQLAGYLLKPDDSAFIECPPRVLSAFLNGLIVKRRGARGEVPVPESRIDNNLVLKKCRVAFSLKDSDVQQMMQVAGLTLSKSEINAFFRQLIR